MFNGGIRLCKLFGTEIYLHPMWFLMLFLFVFPPLAMGSFVGAATGFFLLMGVYVSVVAHEFAHIYAGYRLYGIRTPRIVINFFGGAALMERIPFGLPEAAIGIAGPALSAILGNLIVLPFLLLHISHKDGIPNLIYMIGYINLILALFNVLPIFPMDGGRILRGILFHFNRKIVLSTKMAMVVGFVMLPLAFVIILPLNPFTIIVMGVLMWMSWTEWKQVKSLYHDRMKDPNLVRPDQVQWYGQVISLFGPGSKQAKDVRVMYSNAEFDKVADDMDAAWQTFSPEEKLGVQTASVQYLLTKHDPKLLEQLQHILKAPEEK